MGERLSETLTVLVRRDPDPKCMTCEGRGWVDSVHPMGVGQTEDCECRRDGWRSPTDADIVAHLLALPSAEREALLRALLRAAPDVDTAKVARAWSRSHGLGLYERIPINDRSVRCAMAIASPQEDGPLRWDTGRGSHATQAEARLTEEGRLLADGWVLAGGGR